MKTAHKWLLGIGSFLLILFITVWIIIYSYLTSANGRIMLANMGYFNPPHSKRTQKQESLFFINFETKSDDNLPWGAYCSRLLYFKIKFAPDEILYLPPFDQLFQDMERYKVINVRNASLPHEGELFLARAYGIENVLHGTVSKQGDQISFEGTLIKVDTDSPIASIKESGSLKDPSGFISKLGLSIFHTMNVTLTKKELQVLQQPLIQNPQAFFTALEAFSQPNELSNKSADIYKQAISLDTNFIYAYVSADGRMSTYDPAGSRTFMQDAIRQHPNNPFLRLYNLRIRKNLRAMQFLMDYPDNLDALTQLSDYYMYSRYPRYNSAIKVLKYSLQRYPNCWFVNSDLGYMSLKYAQSIRGDTPVSQLNQETLHRYNFLANQANNAYLRAEQLCPNNPVVLCNRMDYAIEFNQPESVILDYFTHATTTNTHETAVWDTLAILYRPEHLNQPKKLHDLYAAALKENPEDLGIAKDMMDRIYYYSIQNHNPKMVTVYREDTATLQLADAVLYSYVTENPWDDYTRYMAAESYYYTQDSVHSWKYYSLITSEPSPTAGVPHEYFLHKAQIAANLNMQDTCLYYLDLCFKNNPCDSCGPAACITKADIFLRRKNMDEGFNLLEKAIQWNPQKAKSYRQYAYEAVQYKSHMDQGARYAQKAIDMDPHNVNSWGALAYVYLAQKDKSKAQVAITNALQVDSTDSWILEVKKDIAKLP